MKKFTINISVWLCTTVLILLVKQGASYMVDNNPYRQAEVLDRQGKYYLEWLVNRSTKRITFSVTVRTTGYVGFGLSQDGKMSGADIVIGGVDRNGHAYFGDRHAVGNHLPKMDPKQNWKLLAAWENGSHTHLRFSRPFDTCDDQDYAITDARIALIWAYGEKDDDIEYHHQNRGVFNVHLLNPSYTPQIVEKHGGVELVGKEYSKAKVWSVRNDWVIPENDTSYWCTMHKAPHMGQEHHIIGFQARFGSEESRRRVHHMIFLRCRAPPGTTGATTFGSFVGQRGQSCLLESTGPMPIQFCIEQQVVWGAGGGAHFLPPHIGVPFGTSEDEYYLLQTHYDNPDRLTNSRVDVSLDIFYTSELREHDAGLFSIGHSIPGLPPSILLPPNTIDHPIFGHCSPQCTRELVPPSGIYIASSFLHSHNSGRSLRLQLFRKNKELPWIHSDGNYGFNFQPHSTLPEDRQILPGDQITMRCDYDSTWTNGTVVGGFSTRQEMCAAWVYYYSTSGSAPAATCTSAITSEDARHRFLGVRNVTWDESRVEFIAQTPPHLAGLPMSQISDNHVQWTLDKREELRQFHKYQPQGAVCLTVGSTVPQTVTRRPVSYPVEIPQYRPPSSCSSWKS